MQDDNLIAELVEKYGLTENPFSVRVRAFYDGAQRRHNLETLRHLSIFGDMVLLLTGDHGAGKTCLIEQFSRNFADEIQVVSLSASTGSERIHTVVRLASICGMDVSPKEPARDVLEHLLDKFTENFERSGKRTLIIIDDAHVLPEEELLLYLQVMSALDAESGAALLLVGLPRLTGAVMSFQNPDREDWLHQIQLKPLNAKDVEEYLRCRMEAAGYVGERILKDSDLERLVELARGNPGAVNDYFPMVATGQLGPVESEVAHSNKVPQYVLFSIAILLSVSFLFVSYQHGFFDVDLPVATVDEAEAPIEKEESLSVLMEKEERLQKIEQAIQQVQTQAPEQENQSALTQESVTEVQDPPPAELVETDGASQEDEAATQNPSTELAAEPKSKPQVDSVVPKELVAQTASAPKVDEVALVEQEKPASDTKKQTAIQAPEVKKVSASKKQSVPELPASADKPYMRSVSWLLEQSPKAYTAQVLGSHNEQTAIKFVKRNIKLDSDLYYLESRYKGKPWFIVLYGVFPDKAQAKAAIKGAGKEVRRQKPWLRSISGVQDSAPK